MSRIGKKPITIPNQVKINIADSKISIEGPKGKLEHVLPNAISAELKDILLVVKIESNNTDTAKSLMGTSRAILANMVKGVTEGYSKQLEIVGVGFRAQAQGNNLNMQLGFTHPVVYAVPVGITIETPKPTQIFIKGIDKAKVGQVAAEIRSVMPPEPYKGKGIRYLGEHVRKKLGKAISKQGAA